MFSCLTSSRPLELTHISSTPLFHCSYLKLRKVDDEDAERQKQLQTIHVGNDTSPEGASPESKGPENKFMGEMDFLNAFLEATFISKLLAGLSRSRSGEEAEAESNS